MNFSTDGCFKDIIYTAELPGLIWGYADQFILAEKLIVLLEEEVVITPKTEYPDRISVSEDGKEITISYKGLLYYKNKTELTDPPTPTEVFSALNRIMKRAVKEDNARFEQLNLNQEEE